MKAKVSGTERKAALLECGAKLAAKHGVKNVTRRMVAKACKVSEPLVTAYMGTTADAQKLYARHAKKLGLTLPTKDQEEAIGAKLRAHGPRKAPVKRTARKRSVKEVKAIKKAVAAKKSPRKAGAAKKLPATAPAVGATNRAGTSPRKAGAAKKPASAASATPAASAPRSTAARKPKAPPPLPPLPLPVVDATLPPLPLAGTL